MTDYIFFCEGNQWVSKWLKPKFGHCYVVRNVKKEWIIVDPRETYAEVRAVRTENFLPDYIRALTGHQYVEFCGDAKNNKQYFKIFNCVSFCKYFIGLDAPMVCTPWQLYKELKRWADTQT